jgi:DNA-binding XRE family transcriptional regulator
MGNYIRVHRKRAGLTQLELGRLIGYNRAFQISRHEQSKTAPSLMVALAYQEIFRVPVSAIFTGMHVTVAQAILRNLGAFEMELRQAGHAGRTASRAAQKLKWIAERTTIA